jgi:hypothetical protein
VTYYLLEPEVPGGFGERTELWQTPDGPRILHLHLEIQFGAQSDDLATSHPAFMVSERVGALLEEHGLRGFRLADLEQTEDEQLDDLGIELDVPHYRWLQISGEAGQDDFGLDGPELVVSQRALDLLQRHAKLSLCEVAPWPAV